MLIAFAFIELIHLIVTAGYKLLTNVIFIIYVMLQASHCVLSVCLVIGLIYRFMLIAETIEKLRSTYFEEFVDISDVEYWDKVCALVCHCCSK